MGGHVGFHHLARGPNWRSGKIGIGILCILLGWGGIAITLRCILSVLLHPILDVANGTYGRLVDFATATI